MGIRNRQRRAAKRKAKARAADRGHQWRADSPPPRTGSGDRPMTEREAVHRLVTDGAMSNDRRALELKADQLADRHPAIVDQELEGSMLWVVGIAWDEGWQPAELVRHARRIDGRAGRFVATAVLADHSVRRADTLDGRWAAQVEAIEAPAVEQPTGWMVAFARREELRRIDLLILALSTLGVLMRSGRLRTILPPPGRRGATRPSTGPTVDDPVLNKVRALLAQAESTTFEAEAEAFTAKAQELMARHAIDVAVLWARAASDERPTSIRLPIDDPYADIKSLLLHQVAQHSRTRAVWDATHALSTVIGFASDLAATELLYTSLLLQAQTALQVEGGRAGPGARTRSRGFRSSFLLAFTHRIDQRLAAVNAAVHDAAQTEHPGALLPALVARDHAVDDEVARQFAELSSSRVRGGRDAVGWARGTLAADLAHLNAGDLARPA
ncbi:MAG: DUF2786 domain-containing protein [Ilumatobacteraceae bacterium]